MTVHFGRSGAINREGVERRQSWCPRCASDRGSPTVVTLAERMKTVGVRCPACGHEWSFTIPDADRRRRQQP